MGSDENHEADHVGSYSWWVFGVIGLYLLPFVVVTADEKVFKTYWFASHLPAWVGDAMRTIYPFYKIFYR